MFADSVILIVDDTPMNLAVLADYLGEYEFEIITALNGEDGLEKAQRIQPDIILLDVMMPGIDGFETCRRLQADDRTQNIPVIFMTALANEEDKVRGFEAGAVDYITKPIQQREVLARITTHLRLVELLRQHQQQRKISDSLQNISKTLNSTLDQQRLLELIMAQLGQVVPFDGAAIFLLQGHLLVLSQGVGFSTHYLGHQARLTDTSSSVIVFNNRQPMLIADTKHDARWQIWNQADPIASWMGAPLVIEQEALGVLTVDSFEAGKYGAEDLVILQTFAHHAAGAIRNAHLYSLTQQMNQQLLRLNEDKDKFFSIVAHDLRGPFLPLLGNLELMVEMADMLPPKEVKDMSAASHRSAKRVFDLLENLLAWARLQMGRMEYEPQVCLLGQVVEQTVSVLSEVAEAKSIQLLNQVEAPQSVYTDRNMLNTVIRNLTNNALKFTPQGGKVILWSKIMPESPHFVMIAVTDTGVGMSAEVQQKLFKLDQHISTAGTSKETGTGLGLIICQEMVMRAGGTIWVESEVGKGTTVKFTVRQVEAMPK